MSIDPRNIKKLIKVEEGVQSAIEALRHQLCREAVNYAIDALHDWAARGVEWYQARYGWIFLRERSSFDLRSIPRATVGSTQRNVRIRVDEMRHSFIWHVLGDKKGDFSNDVRADVRAQDAYGARGYCLLEKSTRSELAVPLFDEQGPEDGEAIGVYNLESDRPNAFIPADVHDLQKNMAMLTPHLLVLKKWRDRKHQDEPWIWHPEVHGWSPGKLAERFCHAVVQGAKLKKSIQPTCTIWNGDIESERCWVLGTCGYDYEFQRQLALDMRTSATGRVCNQGLGVAKRGTLGETDFYNLPKADRMGVREVYIGSLRNEAKNVCGTLNMYSLHESTVLPGHYSMGWLCKQASNLLADFNEMRKNLGIAYINERLARAADPTPRAGNFRRAVMEVLPCDAGSIFVPETQGKSTKLVVIDSTGFRKDPAKVSFPVDAVGTDRDSITAHCFRAQGPVLVNFPGELGANGIPIPNPDNPEVVMDWNPDDKHRRRLGIGVKKSKKRTRSVDESVGANVKSENVGVIRLYRSSAARPFTQADAAFLEAVGSTPRFGRLFENWALERKLPPTAPRLDPDIPIPPSRSIPLLLKPLFDHIQPLSVQFFARRGRKYEEIACYPPHELPAVDEFKPESEEELTVTNIILEGKPTPIFRASFPLRAWSGSHLMRTMLAIDFSDNESAQAAVRDEDRSIHNALAIIPSRLTMNEFYPEPDPETSRESAKTLIFGDAQSLQKFTAKFCDYVTNEAGIPDKSNTEPEDGEPETATSGSKHENVRLFATARCEWFDAASSGSAGYPCPDPDLEAYGVEISSVRSNGLECRIPLRMGRNNSVVLICELDTMFTIRLHSATAGPLDRPISTGSGVEKDWTWSELRRGVGDAVGAWARMLAPVIETRLR